ncbi:MAG: glycosyltransferase [Sphingobacteriales bacterium]|nr:MAG: glycosyltransferase [Sphingobacteriales bacterium]
MEPKNCSILTIAPYRILPPRNGGQLSITYLHHYLGMACSTNVVSTKDNDPADNYSFQLHPVFNTSATRYVPFNQFQKLSSIAKAYDATSIICEHPYMAITAAALARKLKINWYLRSQNIESERFRQLGKPWWKMLALYERYAMELSNGVLFITQEDADWAMRNYRIPASKAHVVPFGTTLAAKPEMTSGRKEKIAQELNLDANKKWIYFLGVLDYKPNEDAVRFILDHVLPGLGEDASNYEVLIGGKGLSEELQQRIARTEGINYLGFVPDLDLFLKACDIMVNPILSGGGIKTKLVEALAYNKLVVSTENGAAGIIRSACGNNMKVTNDWKAFVDAIKSISTQVPDIADDFYKTYFWGNIARKVISIVHC